MDHCGLSVGTRADIIIIACLQSSATLCDHRYYGILLAILELFEVRLRRGLLRQRLEVPERVVRVLVARRRQRTVVRVLQ